jgi:hypothetical protein
VKSIKPIRHARDLTDNERDRLILMCYLSDKPNLEGTCTYVVAHIAAFWAHHRERLLQRGIDKQRVNQYYADCVFTAQDFEFFLMKGLFNRAGKGIYHSTPLGDEVMDTLYRAKWQRGMEL